MLTDHTLAILDHRFTVKGKNVQGNVIVYPNDPARQDDLASIPKLLQKIFLFFSKYINDVVSVKIEEDLKNKAVTTQTNNNPKPVFRLYFNSRTNKRIAFLNENKKEIKYKIESFDDLYQYTEKLKKAIEKSH